MKGKIKMLIKNNQWLTNIFWIIVTALITLFLERSCDRIIPESPILIKEIIDTVSIVHSYDFNNTTDSIVNEQLQKRLLNLELAQKYEDEILKQYKNNSSSNSIMLNASFPNQKGYVLKNGMAYFTFKMSPLNQDYIVFDLSFINESILKDIYCLTLKIHKNINNQHIHILDEFYYLNGISNKIKIANNLPAGAFEFRVGFILKKDRESVYVDTYNISRNVTKN